MPGASTGVFFIPLGGQYSCQGKFKHLFIASWLMQYFLTVCCQFLLFFWKILYYELTLVLTHLKKKIHKTQDFVTLAFKAKGG